MSNRVHQPTPNHRSPARTNSAHTFPAPPRPSISSKNRAVTYLASAFRPATSILRSIPRLGCFAHGSMTKSTKRRLWTRSWLMLTGRRLCGLLRTRHLYSRNVSPDLPDLFLISCSLHVDVGPCFREWFMLHDPVRSSLLTSTISST